MRSSIPARLAAGLAIVALACPAWAQDAVPNEFVVKAKPGRASGAAAAIAAVQGPGATGAAATVSTGAQLVRTAPGLANAQAQLQASGQFQYVVPNYIYHAYDTVPNDPSYGSQWGFDKISAPAAWDVTTGSGSVVVNIIDSGIDADHPDLAANVWVNAAEAGGTPGVDDDANGYVDDINGWNAVANNGDPDDDHGHGTHVAGTIGAVTDNGTQVAGTSWNVSLQACKFLAANGSGNLFDAMECIDYFIATKNAGHNVVVSSNSWGGGPFNGALRDSIQSAHDAGILWVNAAGNDSGNNDCLNAGLGAYPSSYHVDGMLAVASTTSLDGKSGFSNYGASSVDIGAPGSGILSTWPGGITNNISGTSMATPHVAGVAALVASVAPGLSVDELRARILRNGDPIASMDGNVTTGMRLNAYKAVVDAVPAGSEPDRDGDGVADLADNCPYVSNPAQTDTSGNGIGDDCVAADCGGCGGDAGDL